MMPSEQRLHPATLLFDLVVHLRRFAVPAILVMFGATRSSGGPGNMFGRIPSGWEAWLLVLLLPAVLMTIARYLSFRVRYDERELVIRSGLIFRNERHVPYARIQNVDAIQNIFHQLFHVVEVRLETGGGKEEEAKMSVLSQAAFDDLKQHVFAGRQLAGAVPATDDAAPVTAGEGTTIMHLPLRELLLCGLLENKGMVVIGAAYGVMWETGIVDGFWSGLFGRDTAGRGFFRSIAGFLFDGQPLPLFSIALGAALGVGLLLFVRIVSMVWAFVRLYDFRLTRIGDDLRTQYGLFTKVTTTVPIRRVQTITVSSGPLHRLLKRATVRMETAGGNGGSEKSSASVREWLAPLIRRAEVPALLQQVVPGFDLASLDWQPVHSRAFRRRVKPNVIIALLIALVAAGVIGRGAIGLLIVMLPWAVISARKYVEHLGWAEGDEVVVMRSGWIWQDVTLARANKIQSVAMHESPFDRRNAMARVRIDTAGARELSHRIDIPYLDGEIARALHGRLAAHAANTSFKW